MHSVCSNCAGHDSHAVPVQPSRHLQAHIWLEESDVTDVACPLQCVAVLHAVHVGYPMYPSAHLSHAAPAKPCEHTHTHCVLSMLVVTDTARPPHDVTTLQARHVGNPTNPAAQAAHEAESNRWSHAPHVGPDHLSLHVHTHAVPDGSASTAVALPLQCVSLVQRTHVGNPTNPTLHCEHLGPEYPAAQVHTHVSSDVSDVTAVARPEQWIETEHSVHTG